MTTTRGETRQGAFFNTKYTTFGLPHFFFRVKRELTVSIVKDTLDIQTVVYIKNQMKFHIIRTASVHFHLYCIYLYTCFLLKCGKHLLSDENECKCIHIHSFCVMLNFCHFSLFHK